jgi:hypothetical protein
MLAPVGAVTVIVPVATEQVGCAVALAVGAAGTDGCAFTVRLVAVDTHPLVVFFVVTLYVPGATLVNVVPAW